MSIRFASPPLEEAFRFLQPVRAGLVTGAVRGSWLESHFLWQSNTFWSALIVLVLIIVVAVVLSIFGLISLVSTPVTGPAGAAGAGIGFGGAWLALTAGAIVTGIWILYRVIRGWLTLREGRAVHV